MNARKHRCQITCWPELAKGPDPAVRRPLRSSVRVLLKRHLDTGTKRAIKRVSDRLLSKIVGRGREARALFVEEIRERSQPLQPGDLVRVRSRAEIERTLNLWSELESCLYMADMWRYCGTTQRVLKPVERFVDERDYRVKRASGMVLLEGLICEGTPDHGRCDRGCYYFWRTEWLEKVDTSAD